jgi:DNA-binding transcriptional LysR family regulator
MNWELLKIFNAAYECGSLSAAAKRLQSSQPTVGRNIDELERQLGLVLFERSRDGLAPTDAAHQIAKHAGDLSGIVDRISLLSLGRAETIAGTVRITASQIVSAFVLPSLLSDLFEVQPSIEIELVSTNEVENLLRRDADIALRMVRPTQKDLIAKKVNEVDLAVFAHEDYLSKRSVPSEPDDLVNHRLIGYDQADMIVRGFREFGLEVSKDFFSFRSDDQVACWNAIEAGIGIGFGPRWLGQKNPKLVEIDPKVEIPPMPIWLVTHRELQTSKRIRTVFDFLADGLSKINF